MVNYKADINEQTIRDFTGLTTDDVSDTIISGMIAHAVTELNFDISVRHTDQRVRYISVEKQNLIDSSNTTFYVDNIPLGDRDSNGIIDSDDILVYELDQNGVRSDLTVSSIDDAKIGKYTLDTAPSLSKRLFVSYTSVPIDLHPINAIASMALIRLTSALCYTRIDAGKVGSFRVGRVSVTRQSDAFKKYYDDYKKTLAQLRSDIFKMDKFVNVI